MKLRIRYVLLFITIMPLLSSPAWAQVFGEVVVFGDSLSDNGNYVLFPNQPIPDPDTYWQGRFSNGPVWVEYLTDSIHLDLPLTDRALGAAQTSGLTPPGLVEQIQAHILVVGPPLQSDALFVIWIGGNDFLNGNANAQVSVDNVNQALTILADNGALYLLILNLPDLGAIPYTLGSSEAPQATAFSNDFNARLNAMVDAFMANHPNVVVYQFDVYSFFLTVRNDPGAYGFVNATESAPNFDVPGNFDGAGYMFWDDIHPTTSMHALIADEVYDSTFSSLQTEGGATSQPGDANASSCFIQTMTTCNER